MWYLFIVFYVLMAVWFVNKLWVITDGFIWQLKILLIVGCLVLWPILGIPYLYGNTMFLLEKWLSKHK